MQKSASVPFYVWILGGGSVDEVNWALKRGYQFHGKDYSGTRAQRLAESVVAWFDDPRCPER